MGTGQRLGTTMETDRQTFYPGWLKCLLLLSSYIMIDSIFISGLILHLGC